MGGLFLRPVAGLDFGRVVLILRLEPDFLSSPSHLPTFSSPVLSASFIPSSRLTRLFSRFFRARSLVQAVCETAQACLVRQLQWWWEVRNPVSLGAPHVTPRCSCSFLPLSLQHPNRHTKVLAAWISRPTLLEVRQPPYLHGTVTPPSTQS